MSGRKASVERKTKETDVKISIDLDGSGKYAISCQEQFLRHMLETFSKYSSYDLDVMAVGDNEHHLVEDVAITLGSAVRQAMGDAPVERIASAVVPMDDALVEVTLDIIDRPYADIDCPDPLWHHFFRSFAMSSGITLHVIVKRGFDEHHVVEATFKALGTAMRKATTARATLLSTKAKPQVRRGK
ncbi:MAG: imidazoleglycerol-phosphate dehydratase [Methanomassiliicoccales archaeon PtaU1.Bin124]|nr:MAG: imidazoleglycerol-phosphate dehydratase [Methanomassiliicoccales archaeon PtaU1.Bin124]